MSELILKRNKNMVSRTIGQETILLPICKDTNETNCIYTLNKAAARIWELIDGKRDIAKIKKAVLEEFDVKEAQCDKALAELLKDLKAIKAVNS
jgi:methyltransferase-like protein